MRTWILARLLVDGEWKLVLETPETIKKDYNLIPEDEAIELSQDDMELVREWFNEQLAQVYKTAEIRKPVLQDYFGIIQVKLGEIHKLLNFMGDKFDTNTPFKQVRENESSKQ